MPAFRNVAPNRQSGRLGKHIPVTYDSADIDVFIFRHLLIIVINVVEDGWEVPSHEVEVEPFDYDVPIPSPSPTLPWTPYPEYVSHALQQGRVLTSSLVGSPFNVDAPSSIIPARRRSRTHSRDPGHIPRPRNAFIFFRSSYINGEIAAGQGQQNELSKQAGKVWNMMSAEEKRPFCELAAIEKEEHYVKYPAYVYSPGRIGVKGKPKSSRARNIGGDRVTSTPVKKKKVSTTFEDSWSRSSNTSSGPTPPASPFSQAPRPAKSQRATAQRVVQRFVESPLSTPSARLGVTLIPDEFQHPECSNSRDDVFATPPPLSYVSTFYIPELELTPRSKEEKSFEAEREPPSPLHSHLDPVTGEYAYRDYNHDYMSTSMPILPRMPSYYEHIDDTHIGIPFINLQAYSYVPTPFSLLCDNPYPHTDFLAALNSSYTFSGELEGDSVMQQYTDMMEIDNGRTEYFEIEQDPYASTLQFFIFE
ncbi:hypothetical protein CVT25_010596 [Psilocybe cyanescens]|uniref:HMG box domain-containing protein n=1 Tax=Psilocybe cyanescens TaxID=93625 RepID=A0A409WJF9_PSICY|nr:hypothetical protein CVT25_010596 [Psilocybe cyanescens]